MRSVRENVEQALADLAQAAASLGAVAARLDNIDELLSDAPVVPNCCAVCAAAGLEVSPDRLSHAPQRFGTVGGRVEVDTHLCGACYQFVFRNGVVPTPEQVLHHNATGS